MTEGRDMRPGDQIPGWAIRCPTGKQKFASADAARDAMRQDKWVKKPINGLKGSMRPYLCRACDMYHLTSAARRSDGHKHGKPWTARAQKAQTDRRQSTDDG